MTASPSSTSSSYAGTRVQPAYLSFLSLPVYLTSPYSRILTIAFPLLSTISGSESSFLSALFSSESFILGCSSWLERHYGSAKFFGFTVINLTIYTVIMEISARFGSSFVANILLSSPTLLEINGIFFDPLWIPYCLFYSSMWIFHQEIISDSEVELFSMKALKVPEKSLFYIMGIYVITRSNFSAYYGLVGLFVGALYHAVKPFQRFQLNLLPAFIEDFFTVKFRQNSRTSVNQSRLNRGVAVSESHIQNLVSMGFTRDDAIRALQQSNNNLQRASNILLD